MIDPPRSPAASQPVPPATRLPFRLIPRWNHEPGPRLTPHWTRLCAPRDGGALYTIEPPDGPLSRAKAARWCWRRVDAPDRTLDPFEDAALCSRGAVNRSHLFGRLRIATFDDGDYAVLVRHVDSPVYAMRLPG